MEGRAGISRGGVVRWTSILAASALMAVLGHPAIAAADPIVAKRSQAAAIATQLATDNRRIDQLSERYDGARVQAQQVGANLAAARSALAATDSQAQVLRARLTGVAVNAYLRSGQPLTVRIPDRAHVSMATVGRTYEELAAGNERQLLDAARALRSVLTEQRATLEAASRDATAAEAKVADLKRAAQAAMADEQALLAQVTGQLATLVAQAQAEQQARMAAEARSGLAARAAREAAAARARQRAPVPVTSPGPGPPPPPPSSKAGIAVATAKAQVGKPYQWGAAGPDSFDCSGLTKFAWAAAGVTLDHFSGAQYAGSTHIPLSALQLGDLVFFYSDLSHVGIYVGGGQMIHAPHPGTNVTYASIYQMGTSVILAGRVS